MNKSKLVVYAAMGSLVTVLIWSFIGGCHNAPDKAVKPRPEEALSSPEEAPEEIPEAVETEEILIAERIIVDEPVVEVPESKPPVKEAVSAPAEPSGKTYVVEKGDTLWAISHTYGVTVSAIQEANKLKDAGSLFIGQKLIIP
ncbi:MAG: LysM peptidoglycan-binding domain-containing protein [Candidatus Auribacterota bacterium]|nr:LysM peptidoglycan-binding domain-containing protein [Candidatus Auribacterota bacterium]